MSKRIKSKVAVARAACALITGSLALSSGAEAQGVPCDGTGNIPCGFQIQEVELQPAPQVFKFQARVSQAKLPIGRGVFDRVIVNLKRGDATLCREEFREVLVQESVINLEIGRNMSCEIDQVIAENQNLAFQVCIGGPENCLRPIALASTPYAVKSTFASQAQTAHKADIAAQANYTHRVTADRDLFVTKELGTGYFDFYTPGEAPLLYTPAEFETYENGGFLQWTPMNEQEATLHIVAKNHVSDKMMPLEKLVLGANATETTGRVNVRAGGVHVVGASDVTGNTTVRGQLKVEKPAGTGPQGLHVNGNSSVTGRLSVTDGLSLSPGGLMCEGPASFTGQVTAQDVQVNGVLRVNGELSIPGEVNLGGVSADFSVGNDLTVGGGAQVTNGLAVAGGMSLLPSANGNGGTAVSHGPGDKLRLNEGGTFAGGVEVQSGLNVTGAVTATALNVTGAVTATGLNVSGAVTATGRVTAPNLATDGVVCNTNDCLFLDKVDVKGTLNADGAATLQGGALVIGGLNVSTGGIRIAGSTVNAYTMSTQGDWTIARSAPGPADVVMMSTSRATCFLYLVQIGDIWQDNDTAECQVYQSGGNWVLRAWVNTNGTDAFCGGRCVSW